jgi:hypothetical protein
MAGQLRKDDVGSIIRVRVVENGLPFDASSALVKTYKLKRPSGSVMTVPVSFESDGVNGTFVYVTVENDLSESGPWSGQVFMEFTTGKWHTDHFNFNVGENIE